MIQQKQIKTEESNEPRGDNVQGENELEAILVPYDENLLERARTQWQFGDWDSLAKINYDSLVHHPDRAKLALLAAAGKLQLGLPSEAMQFIRSAQEWGVEKQFIARILIAGVYNNLGRALAIAGQPSRAVQHFETAVSVGVPGGDTRLFSKVRSDYQLTQIGFTNTVGYSRTELVEKKSMSGTLSPLSQSIGLIAETLKQQKLDIDAQLKKQAIELNRLRDALSKTVKSEVTNAAKQLEAFIGIQNYFDSGQITGELHGWPISPDLAVYLIQQIESKSYDLIIEFGSGTSTQLIAKVLKSVAQRDITRTKPIQVAFEHLDNFHNKTLSLLKQVGLLDVVELFLTPLQPYKGPDQLDYSYYECKYVMEKLQCMVLKPNPLILAFVDGPPAITGPYARYPALPILMDNFPEANIDLILDDYNRDEERKVVAKWIDYLNDNGRRFVMHEELLDKGACKICISPLGD